jgi:ribonuclease R
MPSPDAILKFISESDVPAGKREIARHFGLKGAEKIALKALLKDMADEGLIDSAPGRAFHKMGGVPKVTVLRIVEIDDREPIAIPDNWQAEGLPAPRLRVVERGRRNALAVGDRILARTEEAGKGWRAYVMKKLERSAEMLLGVVEKEGDQFWLRPVDKRIRRSTLITDIGDAEVGQLVEAEPVGYRGKTSARVMKVLGEPLAPRAFSLIAIHKYGLPHAFSADAVREAEAAAKLPVTADRREDLRHLPIIAIDPVDARDHDDAIWAMPDDDAQNPGGYKAIIAIADVSYYVRPGGALDREARKRGNSVYFPDQVVPMLPEILSADRCSLKQDEDRAAMACHLTIDAKGKLKSWRFTRAIVRLAANIAYEDAQARYDAQQSGKDDAFARDVLAPLWECWKLLFKARQAREPLDLDLPERRIVLDEMGRIVDVSTRERLDAHRLVEDFMIAANVAAAKALEDKKAPVVYRVHETPPREKLVALKDYLDTFGISFALGQVVKPGTFNNILTKTDDETLLPLVMEQILRSQTQAVYSPKNQGHFGLALASYGHFTSPIRRYADLLLHRSLVDAFQLEQAKHDIDTVPPRSGLHDADAASLDPICEAISGFERRAMEAERETVDRYVAAFLSTKVGEVHKARITGVQKFGFFATIEEFGGDGLVPASTLGNEYFRYDEQSQTLVGEQSGDTFHVGQKLDLRVAEADPISGGLKFELPDTGDNGSSKRSHTPREQTGKAGKHKRRIQNKRGRPANIKHKSR